MSMRHIRFGIAGLFALLLSACAAPVANQPSATAAPTQPAQPATARPPATALPQPSAAAPMPTAVAAPPAEALATPVLSSTEAAQAVVRAFLTRFAGGGDPSVDVASFLSSNLRAKIRPDYPLNLILGVQNMYSGFEILDANGADGQVNVRATLTYGEPKPWSFEVINEDGAWRIDQISSPDGPTIPAPTAVPDSYSSAGAVVYLDPDGVSIDRINADGSGWEQVYPNIAEALGQPVSFLGAAPGGQSVLVGAGAHYVTVGGGVRVDLGDFAAPPRWSPDGLRVAGATKTASGAPGPIAIFDLTSRQTTALAGAGTPDWYPDGQHLVYAGCPGEPGGLGCNVYRYDLASGASTQLSQLTSTAEDRWYVQEAHVLPSGNEIIFYGNHTSQVGASGNGLQWWWMPIDGGEAQLFSQNFGNGLTGYQADPRGQLIAYSARAHWSACASVGDIIVRDTSPQGDSARGLHPQLPGLDMQNELFADVLGIGWDPAGSGRLAFGSQAYSCAPQGRQMQTPAIYVWETVGSGGSPHKLADGSFPVWML